MNLHITVNGYSYDLGDYSPIAPGLFWNYEANYNNETKNRKIVHGDYETFNGVQTVPIELHVSLSTEEPIMVERNFLSYDSNYIYFHGMEQVVGAPWSDNLLGQYIFEPPITFNRNIDVGESWILSATVTDPNAGTSSFSMTFTLVSVEDVVVPAGSFSNCLKIQLTFSDEPGEIEYEWWARGVGEVKFEHQTAPDETEVFELTSYGVKRAIPGALLLLLGD